MSREEKKGVAEEGINSGSDKKGGDSDGSLEGAIMPPPPAITSPSISTPLPPPTGIACNIGKVVGSIMTTTTAAALPSTATAALPSTVLSIVQYFHDQVESSPLLSSLTSLSSPPSPLILYPLRCYLGRVPLLILYQLLIVYRSILTLSIVTHCY